MVLDRLFSKRATSGFANPQKWLVDWVHGDGTSAAGVRVTPESALTFSTYYACVRTIAETMASLPFFVYRNLSPRGKERAKDHEVNSLIHDEPNRETTSMQFWETIVGHAASWGNGYAQIVRDDSGYRRAVEMWNLSPNSVKPDRRPKPPYELFYRVVDGRGNTTDLAPSQVFHLPNWGWDGTTGKSPAQLHKNTLGLGLAAVEHNAKFFANGALPRGVLQSPVNVKGGTKAIRDDWKKIYGSGDDNIAVLMGDMKYQPITMSAADAQLILLLKWTVAEVCRAFRMPLQKVQDYEKLSYNNAEQLAIDFVQGVVLPWGKRIAQECNRKLLLERERRAFFCEHVVEGLLRGDFKTRIDGYRQAILGGWMSPDDVRELENLNPLPDGIGNIYVMQGQMTPVDQLSKEPEPEPESPPVEPEPEPDDEEDDRMALLANSYRGLFEDGFARVFRVESDKLNRAAKRENDLQGWVRDFYDNDAEAVCGVMGVAVDACGSAVYAMQTGKAADDCIRARLLAHTRALATRHVQLTRAAVEQAIEGEDPAEGLRTLFTKWQNRPAAMAEQETKLLLASMRELN